MVADREAHAYAYIRSVLKTLGWDTRNPRHGGRVYTQQEFYKHDEHLTATLGLNTPENVVLIDWHGIKHYWIVEAKSRHHDLAQAMDEAQGYANTINESYPNEARFATGIAGNDHASYYVSTSYWDGDSWQTVEINNYGTTGFLTPTQCQSILERNSPKILDYDVDLKTFLRKANDINSSLHKNGVAAKDRARFVAGLLLALAQDPHMTINDTPSTLVGDVNSRIEALLQRHGKGQYLAEMKLNIPITNENHRKYWSAIVQTSQHLRELNVRSAINSGTDALGQFYETFLKYANDASEMGIVLTPRHVTRFAVEVMNLRHEDRIFDPTCSTGGFLVSALDYIRSDYYSSHPDVYEQFRNDCLFGVESADTIFGLALVNMVFRGDGKSHIHNGNCFDNRFILQDGQVKRIGFNDPIPNGAVAPFSRVLMNPPFALDEKEYEFVDYALEQMSVGGLLFAVLPNVPVNGDGGTVWRMHLLERHTLRVSIKLPDDLFRPNVSKGTWAIIVQSGRPHRRDDDVYFALLHDDRSTSKSKTLSDTNSLDNLDRIQAETKAFIQGFQEKTPVVNGESCIAKLRMKDDYDFSPEHYVSNRIVPMQPPEDLFVALARRTFKRDRVMSVVHEKTQLHLDDVFDITRGDAPPQIYDEWEYTCHYDDRSKQWDRWIFCGYWCDDVAKCDYY
ncbi:MAG: N-6 DNA methylase [Gammaproteobacteria bacterium]|nr:N-6 DNA methylase [Gammaproteobacteria bacterium]